MVRFAWMPYSNQMSGDDCFVHFQPSHFEMGPKIGTKNRAYPFK
jgi:hypothetical protein